MKKFFTGLLKNVLTLVLGYCALFVLGIVLTWFLLGALEEPERPIAQGSFLVLNLDGNISDAPANRGPGAVISDALGGGAPRGYGLLELLRAIETGGNDPRVAGLFLYGSLKPEGYGSGLGTVRELRRAVEGFRAASGKPVVAFLDQPQLRDYYLASAADRVVLNPFALLGLNGLVAELPFFADALEKVGVGVQIVRVGDYKSAVEPFVRMDMSEENREQYESLLNGLWDEVLSDISGSRKISAKAIRSGGPGGAGIYDADAALAAGLVDECAYFDEVIDSLIEAGAYDEELESFRQVDMRRYIEDTREPTYWEKEPELPEIAVVYAEGDIVDGEGDFGQVGGSWLARKLRELRGDPNIAGVVLRINSPGGSAAASEVIHRELVLLQREMPVSASFGTVAASGGYWIASPADSIFAESTTVTGSIGVFGLLFNIEAVSGRLGIAFDRVRTDPYADVESLTRPKTEAELALIQSFVDQIYDAFIERVAETRPLTAEEVESIAGGRVYGGRTAVELGLVDRIGGLRDAIDEIAQQAQLDDYRIRQIPERLTPVESLASLLTPAGERPVARSHGARKLPLLPELQSALEMLESRTRVYARLPQDLLIR